LSRTAVFFLAIAVVFVPVFVETQEAEQRDDDEHLGEREHGEHGRRGLASKRIQELVIIIIIYELPAASSQQPAANSQQPTIIVP